MGRAEIAGGSSKSERLNKGRGGAPLPSKVERSRAAFTEIAVSQNKGNYSP